jgi:adenylyltransferase/sulfurtransferase
MLSDHQNQRYLRNIILPEIGQVGQEKLLQSRVLVIGAGGLGSSVLLYLAAAGVGNIAIVEDDHVEISNLNRQIIHNSNNLGQKKIASAVEKISLLNPEVKIDSFEFRADHKNLSEIVKNYHLVIDCTDNFQTRFIINQVCFQSKKTLIFAAVKGFVGQLAVFKSYQKDQPCYACFNPNVMDEDQQLPISEKGILGSVASTMGSMQATAAVKEILTIGEDNSKKILFFDFLKNDFRKITLRKNKICKVCS